MKTKLLTLAVGLFGFIAEAQSLSASNSLLVNGHPFPIVATNNLSGFSNFFASTYYVTNGITDKKWNLLWGMTRKCVVDGQPYRVTYWNTDSNYDGKTTIVVGFQAIHVPMIYPARIEVWRGTNESCNNTGNVKIGETNGWYSENDFFESQIVRQMLPQPAVQWLGYVMVGKDSIDPYGYPPEPAVVKNAELGIRSDGVVVWREVEK